MQVIRDINFLEHCPYNFLYFCIFPYLLRNSVNVSECSGILTSLGCRRNFDIKFYVQNCQLTILYYGLCRSACGVPENESRNFTIWQDT